MISQNWLPPVSMSPSYAPFASCLYRRLSKINRWVWPSLVQFCHSVVSDFLQPHGLQYTRLPCPSWSPRACSNSCPLSHWCQPTISSSVIPFNMNLTQDPFKLLLPPWVPECVRFYGQVPIKLRVESILTALFITPKLSPTNLKATLWGVCLPSEAPLGRGAHQGLWPLTPRWEPQQ